MNEFVLTPSIRWLENFADLQLIYQRVWLDSLRVSDELYESVWEPILHLMEIKIGQMHAEIYVPSDLDIIDAS